jgi:hypothetical protein
MVIDPIPYFYEPIDRNAILVRPKKPFYEWLNSVYPEDKTHEKDEHNIYLIREMDHIDEVKKWIQRNFDRLFVNELNDWNTNEDRWPKKRTYKMFSEWFDVEVHSMILDLEDDPVRKD